MPLIKCPDCGRDVSDVAPSCPQCGRPFGPSTKNPTISGVPAAAGPSAVQTIEKTGKTYKAAMALGSVGVIVGMLLMCVGTMGRAGGETGFSAGQGWGCAILSLGAVTYISGRLFGWWDHG